MQQLTRSMGLIKKCGPSNHGVALGPGQMEFEIAAESAWRFGIWDTFCNFLLESFNSMQFRTVDGLGKDMAALMKTLKQKLICFAHERKWHMKSSSGTITNKIP